MNKTDYTVTTIENCTLIFGSIPIDDLVALSKKAGKKAVVSADLASLTGASFVFGLPLDIECLRQSPNLQLSEARLNDFRLATEKGLPAAVTEWLRTGERGRSSEAMCKAIFGIPLNAGTDHPRDPDDLSRCIKFLDAACSEGAGRLHLVDKVKNMSPEWQVLSEYWAKLEECYAREVGNQRPETYELMKHSFTRTEV